MKTGNGRTASNGSSFSGRPTPLEVARHMVSEAHRERVRLRRLRPRRTSPTPRMSAPASPRHGMLVVVGVDLSDSSRRALEWAAREAQWHHGRLTACWTGRLPAATTSAGSGQLGSARSDLDKIEDDLLALIAQWAPDLDPVIRLGESAVEAGADELLELSRNADLLVLACSNDGHWGRPSAVNVRRIVGRASCPVVLVP